MAPLWEEEVSTALRERIWCVCVYVYVGCFVTAVTFSTVKKEKIPTSNMHLNRSISGKKNAT